MSRQPILAYFGHHKCASSYITNVMHAICRVCYGFQAATQGRREGEEDRRSHYRKGVVGDRQQYFSPRLKQAFKERYAGLTVQLGYAEDNNW